MKKREDFKNLKIEPEENSNVKSYKETKKKPNSPQRDVNSTNSEEHNVSKSKKSAFEKNKTSFLDEDVSLKKHELNQQKDENKEFNEIEKDQLDDPENKENLKMPEKKEKTSSKHQTKDKPKSKSESPKKKNREEDKPNQKNKEKNKEVKNKSNKTEKDGKSKSNKNEENKVANQAEPNKKGDDKKHDDTKGNPKNKDEKKQKKEKDHSKEEKKNLKAKKNESQEKISIKDNKDHKIPLPENNINKDCEILIPLVNGVNNQGEVNNSVINVKRKSKSRSVERTSLECVEKEQKIELKNLKISFQRFVFLFFCFICWNLAFLVLSFLELHDLYLKKNGVLKDQFANQKVITFIAMIIYFGSWILNFLTLISLEKSKSLTLYKFVFSFCFYLTIATIIGYTTYFLKEYANMNINHYYKIFYESILVFSVASIFLIKYTKLQIFTGFSIFVYIFTLKIFSEGFDLYKKEIILYLLNTGQYFFIVMFGSLAILKYPFESEEIVKKYELANKEMNSNLDILIEMKDNNLEIKKSTEEFSKIIEEDKIKMQDFEKKMSLFTFSLNNYGKLMILFDHFWNVLEFTSLAQAKFQCEVEKNFDDLMKINSKLKSISVTGVIIFQTIFN